MMAATVSRTIWEAPCCSRAGISAHEVRTEGHSDDRSWWNRRRSLPRRTAISLGLHIGRSSTRSVHLYAAGPATLEPPSTDGSSVRDHDCVAGLYLRRADLPTPHFG